jgi:hypothetical protein
MQGPKKRSDTRRLTAIRSFESSNAVLAADHNATLWVLRGDLALGCFRLRADSRGHVTAASVADFAMVDVGRDFNLILRKKLFERYGERCEIFVQVDGGAGFDAFHHGGLPERPKRPEASAKQEKLDL